MNNEASADAEERFRKMLAIAGLPVRASYRVEELCTIFNISEMTAYRMIKDEIIRAIRIRGVSLRIEFFAIVEFIENGTDAALDDSGRWGEP